MQKLIFQSFIKIVIISLIISLIVSCLRKSNTVDFVEKNYHIIKLEKPTVIIVGLDSVELDSLRLKYGDDNFYTAADDIVYYNYLISKKLDSLKIEKKYVDYDSVLVKYEKNKTKEIIKDSTFSIFNYFYFDGKKLERKELQGIIDF